MLPPKKVRSLYCSMGFGKRARCVVISCGMGERGTDGGRVGDIP